MAQRVRGDVIPRFADVRRVPTRYQRVLPLAFMLQCRCVVLGSAPGVLTVAVTERDTATLLVVLAQMTNCSIFPVLVEGKRMHLLLQRLARAQRRRKFYPQLGAVIYLL